MEILSSKLRQEYMVGDLVQIEIVKISPQISHVQAKCKYLMGDLSWRKKKEIRESKGKMGRYARQWKKSEEEKLSQVSVVRETSTEIVEVMPIFANAVFGEMQIHYSPDRWTSL